MSNHNPPVEESTDTTEVEQLKNELESLRAEFAAYRKAVSKRFSNHEEELQEIEDQVRADGAPSSGDEPQGESGENRSQSGDLLPIERLARMEDDEDASDQIMADTTPSVERAVVLYENFREWSKKTPKGRTITSGLKDLLSAATGERLAWRQVYRTLDKIEEWSKGAIRHEQTSRHGHVLVADEQASSLRIG